MRKHSNVGGGNAVYNLYNELADNFWSLIANDIKNSPNDRITYLFMHEDKNDFGDIKPKTVRQVA